MNVASQGGRRAGWAPVASSHTPRSYGSRPSDKTWPAVQRQRKSDRSASRTVRAARPIRKTSTTAKSSTRAARRRSTRCARGAFIEARLACGRRFSPLVSERDCVIDTNEVHERARRAESCCDKRGEVEGLG